MSAPPPSGRRLLVSAQTTRQITRNEPAYLVLARVLLAQGDPGPALTLLQRLLDAAASQGRTGSIIEIQALRALALAAAAITPAPSAR